MARGRVSFLRVRYALCLSAETSRRLRVSCALKNGSQPARYAYSDSVRLLTTYVGATSMSIYPGCNRPRGQCSRSSSMRSFSEDRVGAHAGRMWCRTSRRLANCRSCMRTAVCDGSMSRRNATQASPGRVALKNGAPHQPIRGPLSRHSLEALPRNRWTPVGLEHNIRRAGGSPSH